ncbi:hypothetical protein [Thalassotalea euphylliae]|uniref:Uncharacterized protein n=1 Tax=Thalassotalea euphylliae TaxID=1655234 RepID=A0A3E0U6F0_9GAMM|nr:hypothetical protein [Thalassotalea euphylliae]REL27388.1 hypothetical protein DXX93_12975 [Thalassotalea euphylliae]REL32538.1 hypothetical protein DXX94_18480 [Thalassotalea euphylliae]
MRLESEYIIKGIEILVGLASGYLTYKLADDGSSLSALLSVVVGLLSTLIMVLFVETYRQHADIKDVKSTYEQLIKIISESKHQVEQKMSYILKYGIVSFEDRDMPSVWRELLWNVKSCYYATNYIRSDDIYNNPWADAALAIQKAKTFGENVDIKKVFIVDSEDELARLMPTIEAQKDAGINTRYILKNDIENSITLKAESNEIESIDFGIFDDSSVFIWKLKERSFVGGEIKLKSEELVRYKAFYNHMFSQATPI